MLRSSPEWPSKILALRKARKLTQQQFAEQLGTSAMTVSRWERGELEPQAKAYISLGNMAGDPTCWFFWEQAGFIIADVRRALPAADRRSVKVANVQIVHAGAVKARSIKPEDLIAIPLLPIRAATLGEEADEVADLDQLKPEAIWAAPASWCPNPAQTISLRVKGDSMSPLILDGYIIAVDTGEVRRDKLDGQIVVARNIQEKQWIVSRFKRFDHTDALVSDQSEHQYVLLGAETKWRIVGRVLWWTGRQEFRS